MWLNRQLVMRASVVFASVIAMFAGSLLTAQAHANTNNPHHIIPEWTLCGVEDLHWVYYGSTGAIKLSLDGTTIYAGLQIEVSIHTGEFCGGVRGDGSVISTRYSGVVTVNLSWGTTQNNWTDVQPPFTANYAGNDVLVGGNTYLPSQEGCKQGWATADTDASVPDIAIPAPINGFAIQLPACGAQP